MLSGIQPWALPSFLDVLLYHGVALPLITAVAILVPIAGLRLLYKGATQRKWLQYVVLAAVPLLSGLLGCFAGVIRCQLILPDLSSLDPERLYKEMAGLSYCVYTGAAGSAVSLLVAWLVRKKAQTNQAGYREP